MTSQELTPEQQQLEALEPWNASLRRSFSAQGDTIADRLERLAEHIRTVSGPSRTLVAGLEDRPERFAGIAAEIQHEILWSLANLNLDQLTRKAGEIEVTAADIRDLRKRIEEKGSR